MKENKWFLLCKWLKRILKLCVLSLIIYLIVMICSCRQEGPVSWKTYIPFSSYYYFKRYPLDFKTGFAIWIDERRYVNGDLAFYYYAHSQVFTLDSDDCDLLFEIVPIILAIGEKDKSVPKEPLGLQLGFYGARFIDGIRIELNICAYGYCLRYYSNRQRYELVSGKHIPKTLRLWEKYSQQHIWREMCSVEKRWILAQRAHDSELQDVEDDVFSLRNTIGENPIDTGNSWDSKKELEYWQHLRKRENESK